MQQASDKAERARRARMAAYVFLWFLDDAIKVDSRGTRACEVK